MENIKISSDHVVVSVNPKIYSLPTIYSAAYVFLDRAYIILDGDPEKEILVNLKPKKECNLEKLGLEFLNELISYANYSNNVKENNEIVKMIIQRALFSADKNLIDKIEEEEIEKLLKDLEMEEKEENNANEKK